jgi:hypothetical protein
VEGEDDSPEGIQSVTNEELINAVVQGAELYSQLSESFIDQFSFYGQTLTEWGTELTVELPDENELTPSTYRAKLLELGVKYQRAANYHSLACSLAKTFEGGAEIKKNEVVNAIVAQYANQNKKRPAGTIVERMADSYMKSTVSSRVAALLVRDFWKQRLDALELVRKLFEQIGMSLNVEMKHTAQS